MLRLFGEMRERRSRFHVAWRWRGAGLCQAGAGRGVSVRGRPHLLRIAVASGLAALAIGAAAATPAPTPAGVDLWNGATLGMNIDTVQALFPASKVWTGQSIENGALAALRAPARLGDAPAQAVFFFHGRSLAAVIVERDQLAASDRAGNLAEARALAAAATRQYGAPAHCTDRPSLAVFDCVWFSGGVRIALGYHDVGGGSPALSVAYGPVR